MRGATQGGRFDSRYEVSSMYEGMADELYDPAGVVLVWFVFDPDRTVVDPIYDVGDQPTGGRRWTGPYRVPVLGVRMFQGETAQNKRGFYTSDTLHAVINAGQIEKVLRDIHSNTDIHLKDRFLYRGELWEPTRIWCRGVVKTDYTVVSLDASQVKSEQVVNDFQFLAYADPGTLDENAFHGTGFVYRGLFDAAAVYYKNDVVLVDGQLWVVVDDNDGAGVTGEFP